MSHKKIFALVSASLVALSGVACSPKGQSSNQINLQAQPNHQVNQQTDQQNVMQVVDLIADNPEGKTMSTDTIGVTTPNAGQKSDTEFKVKQALPPPPTGMGSGTNTTTPSSSPVPSTNPVINYATAQLSLTFTMTTAGQSKSTTINVIPSQQIVVKPSGPKYQAYSLQVELLANGTKIAQIVQNARLFGGVNTPFSSLPWQAVGTQSVTAINSVDAEAVTVPSSNPQPVQTLTPATSIEANTVASNPVFTINKSSARNGELIQYGVSNLPANSSFYLYSSYAGTTSWSRTTMTTDAYGRWNASFNLNDTVGRTFVFWAQSLSSGVESNRVQLTVQP